MNVLEKEKSSVTVTGRGKNRKEVFADALSSVQKQITKYADNVPVRIEPVTITILSAEEKSYMERFLFFFFPRKKTEYTLKLKIGIEISSIDVNKVDFKKIDETKPKLFKKSILAKRIKD
ncbi:MAG: DUF4312 family protein [Tetragenococcus koreensis]|nr:DUF4312 family protein [Tetragenococcus koreensis]